MFRAFGGFALRVGERVDRGTILGADVIALTHSLGRVVAFPEGLEQLIVGDLLGVEYHQHRFGMAGTAGAHLLVGRVGGMTAGVTNRSGKDALAELPEFSLRAPEAAQPEHRLLQTLRIRRLQLTPVYEMTLGSGDRMRTARQRFGGAR